MANPIPVVLVQPGVRFATIAPAGFEILAQLPALAKLLGRNVTISCGTEGHPANDPHSSGEAVDLSVLGWSGKEIQNAVAHLRWGLGAEFFYTQYEVKRLEQDLTPDKIGVVNPDASGSHLHIQRRRNTSYPPTKVEP